MHLVHPAAAAPVKKIFIALLILGPTIHVTQGAPQGNVVVFKDIRDFEFEEKYTPKENTHLEHFIYKREVPEGADTPQVAEVRIRNRREASQEHYDTPYHNSVHTRETPPPENDERLDLLERSVFYVGKKLQNLEHKILVRQVDQTGNPGQTDFGSDDLVASLIRQRDDFIAAAAIPQAPLPVQTVRLNSNSGL